jgi:predicted transcriptional regulator
VPIKEVCQILSRHKVIAYTTVLTVMNILERKGVLSHTKSGRAFLYKTILSRPQATRNHVRDSIERFFNGHPEKLLMDVLSNEVLSPEQLEYVKPRLRSWTLKIGFNTHQGQLFWRAKSNFGEVGKT